MKSTFITWDFPLVGSRQHSNVSNFEFNIFGLRVFSLYYKIMISVRGTIANTL